MRSKLEHTRIKQKIARSSKKKTTMPEKMPTLNIPIQQLVALREYKTMKKAHQTRRNSVRRNPTTKQNLLYFLKGNISFSTKTISIEIILWTLFLPLCGNTNSNLHLLLFFHSSSHLSIDVERVSFLFEMFLSASCFVGFSCCCLFFHLTFVHFSQLRHRKHIASMKMNCSSSGNTIKLIGITMYAYIFFGMYIVSDHRFVFDILDAEVDKQERQMNS